MDNEMTVKGYLYIFLAGKIISCFFLSRNIDCHKGLGVNQIF